MFNNVLLYFSGLLTVPVLAGLLWVAWSLFGKSNRLDREGCEYCKAAGLPIHIYDAFEHRRITVWFMDKWHNEVVRHYPAHRQAWQDWYDSLIPGGNLATFHAQWQSRWGTADH